MASFYKSRQDEAQSGHPGGRIKETRKPMLLQGVHAILYLLFFHCPPSSPHFMPMTSPLRLRMRSRL